VITCPKCFKENQDHYKFCLGCGAELPRDASPKKFASGTPPHGLPKTQAQAPSAGFIDESTSLGTGIAAQVKAIAEAAPPLPASPAAAPPPPVAAPPAVTARPPAPAAAPAAPKPVAVAAPPPPVVQAAPAAAKPAGEGPVCPQCGQPNPNNNKFCASCGFRLSKPPPAAVAPATSEPAAAPNGQIAAVLTALRADGTEAGSYNLPVGITVIGRDTGGVFAGDSYLSPKHATFTARGGKISVRDEGSLNGVYKKLRRDDPILVNFGDVFRIGQEIVRFEPLAPMPATADGVDRLGSPSKGYVGRIALIIGRDVTGNAFPVPEMGLHLGRERGDVLFPEDGYVSGLHCRIAWQNGQLFLTDLGSSNGTFIRLSKEADVQTGDILLMGQQLFRVAM
jgi:pSer/pThr/pTyr-binding forkhead associated (FHA) protein